MLNRLVWKVRTAVPWRGLPQRYRLQKTSHGRGWTVEQAARYVKVHAAEACNEERAMGAPFGDSGEGFYCWLTRPRTVTART